MTLISRQLNTFPLKNSHCYNEILIILIITKKNCVWIGLFSLYYSNENTFFIYYVDDNLRNCTLLV